MRIGQVGYKFIGMNETSSLIINPSKLFSMNTFFMVKIFDGLILGNHHASREQEFIINTKITLIINCAPGEVKPASLPEVQVIEFDYLLPNSQFPDSIHQINTTSLLKAIEHHIRQGGAVLICSERGNSRAITLAIIYLMNRYSWSLYATFQFINVKRKNLEIRASFLKLLIDYEKRRSNTIDNEKRRSNRALTLTDNQTIREEEILIRNTCSNAQWRAPLQLPERQSEPSKPQIFPNCQAKPNQSLIDPQRRPSKKVAFITKPEIIPPYSAQCNELLSKEKKNPKMTEYNFCEINSKRKEHRTLNQRMRRLSEKSLTESVLERQQKGRHSSTKKREGKPHDRHHEILAKLKDQNKQKKRSITPNKEIKSSHAQEISSYFHVDQPKHGEKGELPSNIYNVNINIKIDELNIVERRSKLNSSKLKMYLEDRHKKAKNLITNLHPDRGFNRSGVDNASSIQSSVSINRRERPRQGSSIEPPSVIKSRERSKQMQKQRGNQAEKERKTVIVNNYLSKEGNSSA